MTRLKIRIPGFKWGIGAAALAALGLGALAFNLTREREDEVWNRIQERGVFTVATDASYPPFSVYDENGNLFGFDVDLADAIGRRWGVRVEFEDITYDSLLAALISRRDDAVLSAFVPQPERAEEIAYTRPYFVSGAALVVRAEGGEPLTGEPLDWAAGKTLAVEYGAGGDALARHWARRAPGITLLPLPTAAEALAAVEEGRADAAVVDAISAYDYLLSRPALRLAGPLLEPEPYVIAVDVRSRRLLRALEDALAAMEADGTLPALRVKWFGEAAR